MLVPLAALLAAAALQDATAPSPSASPVRVGATIKPPEKIKSVPPSHPLDAVRAGLRGAVVLECSIDTGGHVTGAKVVSGVPPLTGAAVKAVKKWRYTPRLLNGVPVPLIMTGLKGR